MTESGEMLTKPTAEEERRRRRRRRLCWACGACLAVIVILGVVALVLGLVVFRVRQPTTTLVSATPGGIAPRFSLAPFKLELNLTVDIDLLVYNPNRASFAYAGGATALTYRGIDVGQGDVLPGRVPARGSTHLLTRVTVDAAKFLEGPGLLGELAAGRLSLNASTVVPGRVTLLGFVHRHAVTYSDCEFVFGVSLLAPPVILQQNCRQRTRV
ncbi:uncharacterized protein LOC144706335 isoform X1 [Wolffia australiana]